MSTYPIEYKAVDEAAEYGGRATAAELLSGGGNPIQELVFQLFSQNPNKVDYLLYTNQKWSDIAYYDNSGKELKANVVKDARNEWATAWQCLQEQAGLLAGPSQSGTMRNILEQRCDWDPDTPLKRLFEWYELDWEYELPADEASPFGNFPLDTYNVYGDVDWFVSTEGPVNSPAKRHVTWARVADELITSLIPDSDTKAQLNTEVTRIKWDVAPVQVYTETSMYTADKVVYTGSISVLRSDADLLFTPQLPGKVDALDITFYLEDVQPITSPDRKLNPLYKKLYVQFNESMYNQANVPNSEFIFVVPTDDEDIDFVTKCGLWQSIDRFQKEFFDGSRAFVCTFLTKQYETLIDTAGEVPNNIVIDLIETTLNKVLGLPSAVIGDCQRYTGGALDLVAPTGSEACIFQIFDGPEREDWNGAWPTFKPGWKQAHYGCVLADLAANAITCEDADNPVLLFGGDAYCPNFVSFQHGAFLSGIEKANKIINLRLNDAEKAIWADYATPTYCGITPSGGSGNWFVKKSRSSP